ncbi:MAG: hypothetical protein ACM3Q1_05930 [Bacteroidales bacterium]
MRLDAADIRLCLGKSGSGKSTLARSWVRAEKRVLIFDPNGEDDWAKGAHVTDNHAELVELVAAKGRVRICWRGVMTGGEAAFEWANRCAWAAEDMFVVWDEVDRFVTPAQMPPIADNVVQAGRHRGLHVIACSRRPYRMNRTLSALATRMAVFRSTEPRDLRYFAELMGEAAKGIPTLRDYHALDWTEGGTSIKKSPFK